MPKLDYCNVALAGLPSCDLDRLQSVINGAGMRRTTMGDRAFAVAALRAWNSLPDAIRRSPSLAVFKRSLKTHFYIQCFY